MLYDVIPVTCLMYIIIKWRQEDGTALIAEAPYVHKNNIQWSQIPHASGIYHLKPIISTNYVPYFTSQDKCLTSMCKLLLSSKQRHAFRESMHQHIFHIMCFIKILYFFCNAKIPFIIYSSFHYAGFFFDIHIIKWELLLQSLLLSWWMQMHVHY